MSPKFSLLPAREHSCQDAANRRRDAGGQLTHTKERPVRTADKIQKSPASCADRCSLNNCILASAGMAFIWLQREHHLLLFPLPLSILWGWFPKAGAEAPAFVSFQGGAGGNRNPPAFLFRGLGGHSLFKREYPIGFSVPKRYSSAGNPGIFAPKIPSPYPKWEFPCGSRKIPVLTESSIPLPCH